MRLSDGSEWGFVASGPAGRRAARNLAHVLGGDTGPEAELLPVDDVPIVGNAPRDTDGHPHHETVMMACAALGVCERIEQHGGVLLHGALLDHQGDGVVLAGSGGTGKSTASRRVPAPWRALSDDQTLIVRTPEGSYRAHPWPTWSRLNDTSPNERWDVSQSVPLKAVFFLHQSTRNRTTPAARSMACCMLMRNSEQAWWLAHNHMPVERLRRLRLRRLDAVSAMTAHVPAYILEFSLHGAFWDVITRALNGSVHRPDGITAP